jgi:LL-diaminopimelate aminotransferase
MSSYLTAIPKYVFWELDARRRAFRERGRALIDLGIGSPDQPIPASVVDAMREAASERSLSGYPHFRIHPRFSDAATRYMQSRFDVTLDPRREIMALAGSKEGIAELIMSHCDAGDVVLVPEVHYPVYSRAALLVGAVPVFVPFIADGSGRLDLDAIDSENLRRARLIIVNYPGNPTTCSFTIDYLERLVAFSARNQLLLVSDLAYSELSFDGFRVPSVLQAPGAREVAVELHTCSKSFNMAGVRIAFIAGSRRALDLLDGYRSNIGYGVSTLSQLACAAAFERYRDLVPPIVEEYRARRDALVASFAEGGWHVTPPNATMYFWLDIPSGYGDWEWVDALMEQTGIVVTPGMAFGDAGSGKFRISLVQPASVLAQAGKMIASMPVGAGSR